MTEFPIQLLKQSGEIKLTESLPKLIVIVHWIWVSRDECAWSALKAILKIGLEDERYENDAIRESVLEALGEDVY